MRVLASKHISPCSPAYLGLLQSYMEACSWYAARRPSGADRDVLLEICRSIGKGFRDRLRGLETMTKLIAGSVEKWTNFMAALDDCVEVVRASRQQSQEVSQLLVKVLEASSAPDLLIFSETTSEIVHNEELHNGVRTR